MAAAAACGCGGQCTSAFPAANDDKEIIIIIIIIHQLSILLTAGHLEHEPELVLLLGGAAVDAGGVQVAGHLVHLVPGAWGWSQVMLDICIVWTDVPALLPRVQSGRGAGEDLTNSIHVLLYRE